MELNAVCVGLGVSVPTDSSVPLAILTILKVVFILAFSFYHGDRKPFTLFSVYFIHLDFLVDSPAWPIVGRRVSENAKRQDHENIGLNLADNIYLI